MKKATRIAAGILGFAIILGLLALYDGINGDPLSEAHARRMAVAYAQELYPGQTFSVQQIFYDEPFVYRTIVQSQQSRDTYFDVVTRHWTDTSDILSQDGVPMHEWFVESRKNTCIRMGREAAKAAVFILQKELPDLELIPIFGVDADKAEIDLCFSIDHSDLVNYKEYLPLDEDFKLSILDSVPSRFVTQVLWEGIPTQEDLQNTMLRIKTAMEENEMPMTYYNVLLVPENYADNDEAQDYIIDSGNVASTDIK